MLKFYVGCGFQAPDYTMAMATRAEQLGYSGVAIPDHIFYPVEPSTPYPYTASGKPRFPLDAPFPDPFVMMGAIGALTSTIHIRTNVVILPLRHPAALAKAVGTAAVVTGGRIELGVGVGHLRDEFDVLGFEFGDRGRRSDEAIVALRALLRPGPVSYSGEYWEIPPVYIHPAPDQVVPIFVGGESRRALERAALLGDGYVSVPHTLDELESLASELKRLRHELAPDLPPLRLHLDCNDATTIGHYRKLADIGAEAVRIDYRHLSGLDARLEEMARFADDVMAQL